MAHEPELLRSLGLPSASLAECFARYPDTDKNTIHSYAPVYEKLLTPYHHLTWGVVAPEAPRCTKLLEVGARTGGSLQAWADWFPWVTVLGVDNGLEAGLWVPPAERRNQIMVVQADSRIPGTLHKMTEFGGWDIVIDDGCHTPMVQVATWAVLWPHVLPGGIYVIEDVEGITHANDMRALFGGEIIDLRKVKGRHDDILLVFRKPL